MAYSVASPTRQFESPTTYARNLAATFGLAPLSSTAMLEFAGLLTFLGVCIGLIAELS